ncbi:hypothetical protein [Yersinia phage vB_YenM_P744]
MKNVKTTTIHEIAKAAGIKNLKSKGRTREAIIQEVIEVKGWSKYDEATLAFLFNGGEIKQCRDQTTDKPPLGNQSSAGISKRKGKTEFDKRADSLIHFVNTHIKVNSDGDGVALEKFLSDCGLWPVDSDTMIWGEGGLYKMVMDFGLRPKIKDDVEDKPEPKLKTKKEPKLKGDRHTVSKDGLISLSSLCEKYGIDGKVARRKLRTKMTKPDAGWHFTPSEEKDILAIITK